MTTVTPLRTPFGSTSCCKCGCALSYPEAAFDFWEEGIIIEFWSCVACGNHFEVDSNMHSTSTQETLTKTTPPASLAA